MGKEVLLWGSHWQCRTEKASAHAVDAGEHVGVEGSSGQGARGPHSGTVGTSGLQTQEQQCREPEVVWPLG